MRRSAFTLIELLVVIAIIALLVAILVPSLQRARILAGIAACAAGERGIGPALLLYAHEQETLPPHFTQGNLASNYYRNGWCAGADRQHHYDHAVDVGGGYTVYPGWWEVYPHSRNSLGFLDQLDYAPLSTFRCAGQKYPGRLDAGPLWLPGDYAIRWYAPNPLYLGVGWPAGAVWQNNYFAPTILQLEQNWAGIQYIGPAPAVRKSTKVMVGCVLSSAGPPSWETAVPHGDAGNVLWTDGHVTTREGIYSLPSCNQGPARTHQSSGLMWFYAAEFWEELHAHLGL